MSGGFDGGGVSVGFPFAQDRAGNGGQNPAEPDREPLYIFCERRY